jgi:surface protein
MVYFDILVYWYLVYFGMPTPTIITNDNIHDLVRKYCKNRKSELPADLRDKPIGKWDVSRVTNMHRLFYPNYRHFNEPLDEWDVSNVTNMGGMFANCTEFNQPLNSWDVSNVTNMRYMFEGCNAFNQPLNNWNVSKVRNMYQLFYNCESFNQPLNSWNVSNVTNMSVMFAYCHRFNQPLNSWNVSNVTNMEGMFYECYVFNQPLNSWNVSNVTNMKAMFEGCETFNARIEEWDVSNVTDMPGMFRGCQAFDRDISRWDISQANSDGMFDGCPIRESYRPGYVPPLSPTTSKRQLDEFYDRQGIRTKTLSQTCNDEKVCPVTYIRLKHLHRLKRLVILDGTCFSFYAFSHPDAKLNMNPTTGTGWKNKAAVDPQIAFIRKHREYLNREYEELPLSVLDETPPTPPKKTKTPPKKTRSRARSRARETRKTRSLSLPNSVHSRRTRKTRTL